MTAELNERDLALISGLLKYVRRQVQELREEEDGWNKLLELIDELIDAVDSGLATTLINRLYRSATY